MKRRLIEEKGADPSRVHVIHNWADCEAITPRTEGQRVCPRARPGRSVRPDAFGQRRPLAEPRSAHRGGGAAAVAGAARHRHRRRRREAPAAAGRGGAPRADEHPVLSVSAQGAAATSRSRPPMRFSSRSSRGSKATSCRASCTASSRRAVRSSRRSTRAARPRRSRASISCGTIAAPGDADALAAAIAALYDDPAGARVDGRERATRGAAATTAASPCRRTTICSPAWTGGVRGMIKRLFDASLSAVGLRRLGAALVRDSRSRSSSRTAARCSFRRHASA